MKNLIGILVVSLAIVAVLLATCTGPTSDSPSAPSTSSVAPAKSADPPQSPEPTAPPTASPVPAQGTVDDPPAPKEHRSQKTVSLPQALTPSSPTTSSIPVPPTNTAFHSAPLPLLAALPLELYPDANIEAILAVHPRDLEGDSGTSSGFLLVPTDSLRSELRISLSDRDWLPTDFTRGQPASTINTPTAYGQRWGQVFVGAAYQDRIRYDDWTDGIASFGFGLGDPIRYVGLDVTVNILDTYTEFGKDRSLSLSLHRRLPHRTAVAVGHENLWHTYGTDGGSSRYLVVSKVLLLRDRPTSALGSMVLNLGFGNDRFLPEEQFARDEDGVNVFGSLAVRVLPQANAVANWTGQDLALGVSIAPVRTWPLVITPAVVDVTGTAGDGLRFAMSAGVSHTFR